MVDVPIEAPLGRQLLALGLRQGASFSASALPEAYLKEWADYRSEPELRTKAIKKSALLVVVSQDCDIACHNHADDPCVELAVFNSIRPKKMYAGNQFAYSVRKLQLQIGDKCYEAKARETVRVPKQVLCDCLRSPDIDSPLPPGQCRTLVLWRANRYQREAFPDCFVQGFRPLLDSVFPELERIAQVQGDSSQSYIRALYIYIDNLEEEGDCGFSLMVLLRADTPDVVQSKLDDHMDELCQELERREPSFHLIEDDNELASLAEKESTITVATLGRYVKYNLDSASLSHGDPDVGVEYERY